MRADRRDQLERGAHRTFGIVFMGLRITKIDEHGVAHVLGHEAAGTAAPIAASPASPVRSPHELEWNALF